MEPSTDDLSARFLAILRPGPRKPPKPDEDRKPKPPIDDEEYGLFLLRAIRAWEARVIGNPELLATNEAMLARFREITNVAIAVNAERYAIDPRAGASMAECARILKISKPSASERRARGVATMGDRVDRAGAARFSEAQRERQLVADAHDHAVTHLDAYRARHDQAS